MPCCSASGRAGRHAGSTGTATARRPSRGRPRRARSAACGRRRGPDPRSANTRAAARPIASMLTTTQKNTVRTMVSRYRGSVNRSAKLSRPTKTQPWPNGSWWSGWTRPPRRRAVGRRRPSAEAGAAAGPPAEASRRRRCGGPWVRSWPFSALTSPAERERVTLSDRCSRLHRLLELPQHLVAAGHGDVHRLLRGLAALERLPSSSWMMLRISGSRPSRSPPSCPSRCRGQAAPPACRRRGSSRRSPAASTARNPANVTGT